MVNIFKRRELLKCLYNLHAVKMEKSTTIRVQQRGWLMASTIASTN